jgi:hypothetical protein
VVKHLLSKCKTLNSNPSGWIEGKGREGKGREKEKEKEKERKENTRMHAYHPMSIEKTKSDEVTQLRGNDAWDLKSLFNGNHCGHLHYLRDDNRSEVPKQN